MKVKWMTNNCVLSRNGNVNDDANSNNIIFTTKIIYHYRHFIRKRPLKTIKTLKNS